MTERQEFQPTSEWPLQAIYKERLHDRLQEWVEGTLPSLENDPQRKEKEAFLEHLASSVLRGDSMLSYLLQDLDHATVESFRSWYSGELGYVSQQQMAEPRWRHFNALYQIYLSGRQSGEVTD